MLSQYFNRQTRLAWPTQQTLVAAMRGEAPSEKPAVKRDAPGTIGALIASLIASGQYKALSPVSKTGYMSPLNAIREQHGHRSVAGLTKERIKTFILDPLADRPGAALDTLKKLRILIRHAIDKGWINGDPSVGIKRPKCKEIRAWTDAELAAFERRWPIGTNQRTAYALMLNMGTARVDTHALTWHQVDADARYTRHKTKVSVEMAVAEDLRNALEAMPRRQVTVINSKYGKPYTVDSFSGFMRDAIRAAGLPLDCQPHGLRKTLGRLLADAGCTAHEIMAALGHTTLAEAERYTREADRRRGGKRAVTKLDEHRKNKTPQTASERLGKTTKRSDKTRHEEGQWRSPAKGSSRDIRASIQPLPWHSSRVPTPR